jgi:hypothetical protein
MPSDRDDGNTVITHQYTYVSSVTKISLLPFYVVGVIAIAGVVYFVRRKRR